MKKDLQKKRKKEAEELGDKAPAKQVPRTIENTREADITTVDHEDEEVQFDITNDEYASYFANTYEPKILITSSDNPHTVWERILYIISPKWYHVWLIFHFQKTIHFIRELTKIIPNSECRWRHRSSVKKMIRSAKERSFTDVIVVNEDRRNPGNIDHSFPHWHSRLPVNRLISLVFLFSDGILVSHLPNGPTAYFKVSNVKLTKDLKVSCCVSMALRKLFW